MAGGCIFLNYTYVCSLCWLHLAEMGNSPTYDEVSWSTTSCFGAIYLGSGWFRKTNEGDQNQWTYNIWLVVWNMIFFHILGIIISTDYFFQRGWNHQPDIYIYKYIYICIYLYVGGMLNPFASCFGRNYRLPGFLAHTPYLARKNNVLEDLGRLQ